MDISEIAMDEIPKIVAEPVRETSRTSSQRRRVAVAEILGGQREAILEHNGQDYLLRITANGRLILTK
jgi:hemin uptake protein HemP